MEDWFEMAKQYCRNVTSPRDGKTVYIGSDWKTVTSKQFNTEYTLRAGYEITERTIDSMVSSTLFPILKLKPGGQTLVTRMRKSSVCIMPMGNVSSFIVR